MSDEDALISRLVGEADKVIICKEVPAVDFYEVMEIDGKMVVYFGTEESFAKWKREQAQ